MLEGKLRISPISFEDDDAPIEPETPAEEETEEEKKEEETDDDLIEDSEGWDEDGRE